MYYACRNYAHLHIFLKLCIQITEYVGNKFCDIILSLDKTEINNQLWYFNIQVYHQQTDKIIRERT